MILSLHAAGPVTGLALYQDTQATAPYAEQSWDSGRHLATELLGRLQSFLASQDAVFADLNGIIIFSGPGSFTSLRIGHSIANALADSLDIPIVGATGDSWASIARGALPGAPPARPALPHYGAEANITAPPAP